MGSVPNFNYGKESVPFSGLRADIELDPPALVNYDDTIGIMDRSHLGDFITGLGLVECWGPFPESYAEISDSSVLVDGKWVLEAFELADGDLVGLRADHLEEAIRACGGVGGYDPADYELYAPSGTEGFAPIIMTSDVTPEQFIIHRLFGSKAEFLERFGATACPECEEVHDDPFIDCPTCSTRPDAVTHNLELIAEENDGVIVLLAPFVSGQLETAVDQGDLSSRRPTDPPDPEIDVIESPGAD